MCGKIRLFMFRVKENEGSSVIWDIPSGFLTTKGQLGFYSLVPDFPLQLRISYSACLFVARRPHGYNPLQDLIGTI